MRRISSKLVAAVLLTVVLPFAVFALFIEEQMANRLTRHVVQESLLGLAKDLARQLDGFILERGQDLVLLSREPIWHEAIQAHVTEAAIEEVARKKGEEPILPQPPWDPSTFLGWASRAEGGGNEGFAGAELVAPPRALATARLDALCQVRAVYDVVLLVGADGRLVTMSSLHPQGGVLAGDTVARLFGADYSGENWFVRALGGEAVAVNQHSSPWRIHYEGDAVDPATSYQIGFALPVERVGRVEGVLYALVNWSHVQDLVSRPVVEDAFRGLVEPGEDPSPYAWIWDRDADTILAHPNRALYGKSIRKDVGLPQMTDAVLASKTGSGFYPEYRFGGVEKNAAFQRCAGMDAGGFGWVVGVGIDNRDIYRIPNELRRMLLEGSAIVLLMAVAWTFWIAKRTTAPILELQRTTRRVAEGDLSARAVTRAKDELGALAEDFNAMTAELAAQRARIVKAEKDAAWKEMARQIAHDIKNPLTPIQLSLDLLRRARAEGAPGADEILGRTLDLVERQVGNLKRIASEFYEFTGGRKPQPEAIDLTELVEEVLHLHDAWAVQLAVEIDRAHTEAGCIVWADRDKLRRVLVNLATNAMQAMPDGGRLEVATAIAGDRCRVSFRDTGEGLPEEARAHLFEPYFTTKSEGTGLGLAIARRAVEEMDGTITLEPAADGVGTVATVELPRCVDAGATEPA